MTRIQPPGYLALRYCIGRYAQTNIGDLLAAGNGSLMRLSPIRSLVGCGVTIYRIECETICT